MVPMDQFFATNFFHPYRIIEEIFNRFEIAFVTKRWRNFALELLHFIQRNMFKDVNLKVNSYDLYIHLYLHEHSNFHQFHESLASSHHYLTFLLYSICQGRIFLYGRGIGGIFWHILGYSKMNRDAIYLHPEIHAF